MAPKDPLLVLTWFEPLLFFLRVYVAIIYREQKAVWDSVWEMIPP